MTKAKPKKRAAADDDYFALVRRFPLRPIRSETEYDQAVEVLGALVARADDGLTPGERDYADALGQFVGAYDDAHYPIHHELKTPVARLKYLMQEHGMSTTALGELLGSGQGQASLILNGRRELSKANIRILAQRFKVSAALFI